ncbi:serine hydrolase [Streptomyces sp. NPDC097610]|uniref:serine hydrolase n=1 Tax=Streptomyces sp. NPDC097610 TaxID=3157227 RepID=UPI00332D30B8
MVLLQRHLHPGRCGPRRPQRHFVREGAGLGYPRSRRPSGGLWSSVTDLLAVGEGLLADRARLDDIRRPRTTPDDPVVYGLGWALGPSDRMYLDGRLPGCRAAMFLIPDKDYVSVLVTNQQRALRATASALSDMQQSLTNDNLATAMARFAA